MPENPKEAIAIDMNNCTASIVNIIVVALMILLLTCINLLLAQSFNR